MWALVRERRSMIVGSWAPVCGCYNLHWLSGFGQRRVSSVPAIADREATSSVWYKQPRLKERQAFQVLCPASAYCSALSWALRPPFSGPSWEERSVLRWAFRPTSSVLSSVNRTRLKERRESCVLRSRTDPSQQQQAEIHQRLKENSGAHQRGHASSVSSPVSCVRVPLCISDSGQRHTSAGPLRMTQTSREKPAKATRIW